MIQKRSFALTLIKLEEDINYNLETGLSNLKVVQLAKGLAKLATLLVKHYSFCLKSGFKVLSIANDSETNNSVCQSMLASFSKA